jgi:hypothetical protein
MPLNTNSMDAAGLGKTTRLKYVKAISPTGAFPDPWGDDKPEMQKSASSSSKLSKGDKVRLKFSPDVLGTVVGVGNEVAAVEWQGASRGVYRIENLILE